MAYTIPTYDDLVDTCVSYYETALGQDAPLTPKAFLRVLARSQALMIIGLYKLAAERVKQNLATDATGDDLERIGNEHNVPRDAAVAAQLVLTCTGTNGVDIPAGTVFIGDTNGLRYYTQALVTIAAGTASPTVTCYTAGVDSQLEATDTLTLSSKITGIDNSAVVASVSVDGQDEEDEEVYRRRVLDEIQTTGGGSNLADFRNWGEETPDINRVFPYAGAPTTNLLVDGDMELVGVDNWESYSGGTPSKETGTPYEGTQCLRITKTSAGNDGAHQQNVLAPYNEYTVTGYARGDGTVAPFITFGAKTVWTGTSSTSWQAINFTDISDSATDPKNIRLYAAAGGASGNYVEFDLMSVTITEMPSHVTVYAECDSSYEADGIPDSSLLDDVRDYITTDQVTNLARPSLGLIDDNLFIEPIVRTSIYVEIRGLSVATELETQCKSDLDDDIDEYLRNATPYIAGLDTASSQADQITDPLISKVVQDVLDSYGATCMGIGIGTTPGVFLASYSLGAGELAKLGAIAYV